MDIALDFDGLALSGDLVFDGADLSTDAGLRTAVIVALFSSALAGPDDPLPVGETDRRGWWGDMLGDADGDQIGSKRWLYYREKATEQTARKIRDADRAALQFLIDQRVVSGVTDIRIETEWQAGGFLAERIVLVRPEDELAFTFSQAWEAS